MLSILAAPLGACLQGAPSLERTLNLSLAQDGTATGSQQTGSSSTTGSGPFGSGAAPGAALSSRVSAPILSEEQAGEVLDESRPATRPRVVVVMPPPAAGARASDLATSMKAMLQNAGYQVVRPPPRLTPNEQLFFLVPEVATTTADGGAQRIEIEWRVSDAAGEPVGKISQARTLNGGHQGKAWQDLTVLAAAAATEGLDRLVAGQVQN
jgi:hypothetical protein